MQIKTKKSSLKGKIIIPASKSHTIRALVIASLANGESLLHNGLISDDTLSCIKACRSIGAYMHTNGSWKIKGVGGKPSPPFEIMDIGNSGTSLRLLTSVAALADKQITLTGDKSIKKRPMKPLLSALENLGAKTFSNEGKCPIRVEGPIKGGITSIDGISSQFLSSLLIACPLAENDTEITVFDLHEKPYVQMTLDWLDYQSIQYERRDMEWFKIKGGQSYNAFERHIPADFSSATFSACAAAITGSEILIQGLDFSDSQGDKEVFSFLEKMGAGIKHVPEGVIVKGGSLNGIEIDLNNTPDALPCLSVVGCYARGQTRLTNVLQARLKECDRIAACANELKKLGAKIEELSDGLVIYHSPLSGGDVHGYDDHRMVMAMAVAGLACRQEIRVDTAESIKITYPTFVEDMKVLGADIILG
ncbi:MAG: 3-phosphoshikimate 1-carboxyvinyltransferase [bacterium]